jgi:hypothetical protein
MEAHGDATVAPGSSAAGPEVGGEAAPKRVRVGYAAAGDKENAVVAVTAPGKTAAAVAPATNGLRARGLAAHAGASATHGVTAAVSAAVSHAAPRGSVAGNSASHAGGAAPALIAGMELLSTGGGELGAGLQGRPLSTGRGAG